jgi:uncharacterized membrane protein
MPSHLTLGYFKFVPHPLRDFFWKKTMQNIKNFFSSGLGLLVMLLVGLLALQAIFYVIDTKSWLELPFWLLWLPSIAVALISVVTAWVFKSLTIN